MMDREQLRDQCEAYALGVLEGAERAEVQSLIDRRDSDDPVVACVRKELRRRIQGAGAARAAGA